MTFDEVLVHVCDLLQRQGRVAYGTLKRRFGLDDAYLDDLKAELIDARRLAVDEAGRVLVWLGAVEAPTAPAPTPPAVALAPPEAERRQLTVLVCDLVDSTPLARQLDPEDLLAVIQAYQATCTAVIQRFGGQVAQHLGDGLLVYFGYPQAHGDDTLRAMRAGLGIVEALEALNDSLAQRYGVRLALRVGIHTGLVVVGAIGGAGSQAQLALGDTPLLAASLQSLAKPNMVVLSEATARLVHGHFTWQPLGTQRLTVGSPPLMAYHVLGESGEVGAEDVTPPRVFTPLVGREPEVRLLQERWAQVREGQGQVVLLSGEAGIGKSRLVQALKAHVSEVPHTRWECRCSPYYQHTAFYPLIELWERSLQFQRDETPEAKLAKVEAAVAQYTMPLAETVPLLAALLSLPVPEGRYAPLALTPQRQKQRTLGLLVAGTLERAAQCPVVLIVEDLHWVDPSTLEFLTLLIDQGPTAAVFTVLTCRPEFQPPWGLRTHLTPLALHRLPLAQASVLVAQMTGGKGLPPEVTAQIVAKTDGIPLFIEELTKTVLEAGFLREEAGQYVLTGPLPPLAIPPTLHDTLMARLDRLTTVKVVAQIGATLGRTFTYDLLRAVAPLAEAALQYGLRQLVDAELLYQRGVLPQTIYLFKHALIQEAAYQSLLKGTQQQYHQRIAQVLEAQFAEIVETQPELLAYHYTEAGLGAQALPYWRRAGQRALERSANAEAVGHLRQGLQVLGTLPDTPEHVQEELALQMDLGVALSVTQGFAAPEVEQAYRRAHVLCQQVGDVARLFPVLYSLWNFYLARANLQTALETAQQLAALAEREHDTVFLMEAHNILGQTRFLRGEIAVARPHLEHGSTLYDPQAHHSLALVYGEDPGIGCRVFAVWTQWCLGYPEQALHTIRDLETLAEDLAHPYSWAQVLFFGGLGNLLCRNVPTTAAWAERLVALCREQDFALWLAAGLCLQGWARAVQGQWEVGLAQMRQGLADWRGTGAKIWSPFFLAILAEVSFQTEQVDAGVSAVTEALAGVRATGERWWEAEICRLQGEGIQQQGVPDTPQAEACFHQALTIARQQQTRSLELRAAMSLARLWQHQGKRAEARALLAPVYAWFTEGLETADLQEAQVLLQELA